MDTNTVWEQRAAREHDKAWFVTAVADTLTSNPIVTLATDLSGYGEGGWHDAHGNLDEDDRRLVALAAYYQTRGLPVPARHVLVAEDQHLRALKASPSADPPMDKVADLASALRGWGWDADVSADAAGYEQRRYGTDRISYGTCAVTALLVQQVAGGQLARVEVTDVIPLGSSTEPTTVSHYYNILDDGTEVDLTRDQFGTFRHGHNVTEPQLRDRGYLLGHDGTRRRYQLLAERVGLPAVETVDV